METVNSQISASHQSVTDTKNSIGPYRNGPPRRRRHPRKSRADRRRDLNQRNASLQSRKLQKDQNTDSLTENTSVLEFSIDGLYPNDDVIYPPPPNFSHHQISAQELPTDIVSPRAPDVNYNRLSSIKDGQSFCHLQEDNKRESQKRTPHILPDEQEHKIPSKGPHQEPNIQDCRATKNIPHNNGRGRRVSLQTSNSSFVMSPLVSRDPSSSTSHDTVEQKTDEAEVPRVEAVLKVTKTRSQVFEPVSNMHGGQIMVDIEGEPTRERNVILSGPQRSQSPRVVPPSQIISETRPPTHNTKLNKFSRGAPVFGASEPIGGPWIDQEYQLFLNFEMGP